MRVIWVTVVIADLIAVSFLYMFLNSDCHFILLIRNLVAPVLLTSKP